MFERAETMLLGLASGALTGAACLVVARRHLRTSTNRAPQEHGRSELQEQPGAGGPLPGPLQQASGLIHTLKTVRAAATASVEEFKVLVSTDRLVRGDAGDTAAQGSMTQDTHPLGLGPLQAAAAEPAAAEPAVAEPAAAEPAAAEPAAAEPAEAEAGAKAAAEVAAEADREAGGAAEAERALPQQPDTVTKKLASCVTRQHSCSDDGSSSGIPAESGSSDVQAAAELQVQQLTQETVELQLELLVAETAAADAEQQLASMQQSLQQQQLDHQQELAHLAGQLYTATHAAAQSEAQLAQSQAAQSQLQQQLAAAQAALQDKVVQLQASKAQVSTAEGRLQQMQQQLAAVHAHLQSRDRQVQAAAAAIAEVTCRLQAAAAGQQQLQEQLRAAGLPSQATAALLSAMLDLQIQQQAEHRQHQQHQQHQQQDREGEVRCSQMAALQHEQQAAKVACIDKQQQLAALSHRLAAAQQAHQQELQSSQANMAALQQQLWEAQTVAHKSRQQLIILLDELEHREIESVQAAREHEEEQQQLQQQLGAAMGQLAEAEQQVAGLQGTANMRLRLLAAAEVQLAAMAADLEVLATAQQGSSWQTGEQRPQDNQSSHQQPTTAGHQDDEATVQLGPNEATQGKPQQQQEQEQHKEEAEAADKQAQAQLRQALEGVLAQQPVSTAAASCPGSWLQAEKGAAAADLDEPTTLLLAELQEESDALAEQLSELQCYIHTSSNRHADTLDSLEVLGEGLTALRRVTADVVVVAATTVGRVGGSAASSTHTSEAGLRTSHQINTTADTMAKACNSTAAAAAATTAAAVPVPAAAAAGIPPRQRSATGGLSSVPTVAMRRLGLELPRLQYWGSGAGDVAMQDRRAMVLPGMSEAAAAAAAAADAAIGAADGVPVGAASSEFGLQACLDNADAEPAAAAAAADTAEAVDGAAAEGAAAGTASSAGIEPAALPGSVEGAEAGGADTVPDVPVCTANQLEEGTGDGQVALESAWFQRWGSETSEAATWLLSPTSQAAAQQQEEDDILLAGSGDMPSAAAAAAGPGAETGAAAGTAAASVPTPLAGIAPRTMSRLAAVSSATASPQVEEATLAAWGSGMLHASCSNAGQVQAPSTEQAEQQQGQQGHQHQHQQQQQLWVSAATAAMAAVGSTSLSPGPGLQQQLQTALHTVKELQYERLTLQAQVLELAELVQQQQDRLVVDDELLQVLVHSLAMDEAE